MRYYRVTFSNGETEDITVTADVRERVERIVRIEKSKVSFVSEFDATRKAFKLITGKDIVSFIMVRYPPDNAVTVTQRPVKIIDGKMAAAGKDD